MKKAFSTIAAAFIVVLFLSGAAAAADVVGIVDSQKVLFQHPNYDGWCLWLLHRKREMDSVDQEALAAESDMERKLEIVRNRNRILREEEAQALAPIHEECYSATSQVARQKKITVVLEKSALYFGGTDITEDVIRYIKKNTKTKPAPKVP